MGMTIQQVSYFHNLPNELVARILVEAARLSKDPQKIPAVCHLFNRVFKGLVLPDLWRGMKFPEPSLTSRSISVLQLTDPQEGRENFRRLWGHCKDRLGDLGRAFPRRGDGTRLPEIRPFHPTTYEILSEKIQEEEEISLERAWPMIRSALGDDPLLPLVGSKAPEIRRWLTDPANALRLSQVTDLDLRGYELLCVPEEIRCFMHLEYLNLSDNPIRTLTETAFQGFSHLKQLDLRNTQLTILPENVFCDLSNLKSLRLHENRLRVVPKTVFRNLSKLNSLSMSMADESYGYFREWLQRVLPSRCVIVGYPLPLLVE